MIFRWKDRNVTGRRSDTLLLRHSMTKQSRNSFTVTSPVHRASCSSQSVFLRVVPDMQAFVRRAIASSTCVVDSREAKTHSKFVPGQSPNDGLSG